eukprot:s1669_g2.t1
MDFIQDNWKKRGERVVDIQWTGKTFFRVYGPYEADYGVESSEVRECLTDYDFVGQERMGEYMVSLFPPPSIRGVFVEDNQATIRILENGKSPTFRHSDKTQRINLSWLSEQYKRGWYDLTYGPSMMQVADILTKPFTNAEKWRFALALMSHVATKGRPAPDKKPQSASPGEPRPKALASSRSSGEPRARRGFALRETESYSFALTDVVHRSFQRAAESARNFLFAVRLPPPLRLVGTMAAPTVSTSAFAEKPPGFWKQDAEFQVERIDPAHRLSVYTRVQEWERRLAKVRASACACVFPDGYEGANAIGSGQVPVGDVVEALISQDENKTHKTYQDFVDVVGDIPAALFGSCSCPPEGEADLVIVGDSSFALVKNHDNPVTCARLSFGELLQGKEYAIEQIRSVYAGLKWGKGLSAIVHQVWELVEQCERENRLKSRPTLPILVVIGWAGNDVHGDYGYQGCTWIHSSRMTRSDADRKVAADFVAKQYEKVQRSLEAVVTLSQDPRILSVQMIGNGSHDNYNLPPSYNREMGKHFTWLAQRGINGVTSGLLASGGKYDDYHLHDHSFNRKLVFRFLRGAVTFHLKYLEIMTKKAQLRWFAENLIESEQDRREAIRLFPTIVQFRLALARTQEVMMALSPQERTATPAEEFDKADEEILMWVHAGILEAEQEATREGRPEAQSFTDAEMASIVPDAETEEQRGRLFLQEDLQQAQDDGFSIATVESIELPEEGTDTEADVEIVPDVDNWDVIDPNAKALTNPFDEKVKEDEIQEERKKEVEDLNKILAMTSASAMLSGTKADDDTFTRMEGSVTVHPYMEGSVEVIPMEVDEKSAKKTDDPEVTGTEADAPRKGEPSSSSAHDAKTDQPASSEVDDVEAKTDQPASADVVDVEKGFKAYRC